MLSVDDDWARSLAALTLSDVLLVNPVRDGLNLVAKEGPLLNTADGVLVLSHQAGAWEELALDGDGALGVNPFDVAGTADALHAALSPWTRPSGRRGPRRCGPRCAGARRPTGGPTSWPRLRADGGRPPVAASARSRSNATRAGGAGHRQVRRRGHRRRALGVDGGHPHHRAQRPPAGAWQPPGPRRRAGRRRRRRTRPAREARPSCSATRARTTVPLSTSSGGRSSRSCRPCTT